RARQLVIEDDLEQARDVCLILIDFNLDNTPAVELYQSVQSAITKRNVEVKKVAAEDTLSEYKKTVAETKIKQDLAKTYKAVTNATTGKKVYLDQDFNNNYRTVTWDVLLGLANANHVLEDTTQAVKFGVSADTSLFYRGENISAGIDAGGSAMVLNLLGSKAMHWTGSGVASFSLNKVNKYLALRTGFLALGKNHGTLDVEPEIFMTPVAGLGFRSIKFGKSGYLETAIDYYPGHLFADTIDVALGFQLITTYVMAEMGDFNIYFRVGMKDSFMLKETKVVNDAKIFLAIGVGDYE
ncbi:MAG TPA: hypothetical protein VJ861_02440, partial [Treponemataceae bacterium]|nr:hypothetical protein [Treponemataceae bacterium]